MFTVADSHYPAEEPCKTAFKGPSLWIFFLITLNRLDLGHLQNVFYILFQCLFKYWLTYLDKVLVYLKFYTVILLDQILRLNVVPVSFFLDDYKQLLFFNRRLSAISFYGKLKHKMGSVHMMSNSMICVLSSVGKDAVWHSGLCSQVVWMSSVWRWALYQLKFSQAI